MQFFNNTPLAPLDHDRPLITGSQLFGLAGFIFAVWTYLDQKGWPLSVTLSIALDMFLIASVLWISINFYRLRFRRYRIIHAKRGQEGLESLDMLRRAKKHITVMHSYAATPCEEYTTALLEVIEKRGVSLARLMPDDVLSHDNVVAWLKRFSHLPRRLYREHILPGKFVHCPFHFILVDDKEGILYFPDRGYADDATEVVIFRDEQFAQLMRTLVLQMIECPSREQARRGLAAQPQAIPTSSTPPLGDTQTAA